MFRNFNIGTRITGLLVVMVGFIVGVVLVFINLTNTVTDIGLQEVKSVMLADHKARLKLATETTAHMLGEVLKDLPDDKAKADLINAVLLNYRFEDDRSGYYFVYQNTTNVAYPLDPKKRGQDLSGIKDINGVYVIKKLFENARNGGGFLNYHWDKPGVGTQPKLSYSVMIPGTSYWIGTGVYIDNIAVQQQVIKKDMDEHVSENATMTIGIIAAILVLCILPAAIALIASMVKPLRTAIGAAEEVAKGNLDVNIREQGKDEIAALQHALNTMVNTLKANIEDLSAKEAEAHRQTALARESEQQAKEAMDRAAKATQEGILRAATQLEGVVENITDATKDLGNRSEGIRNGTDNQMARINETATAMEEMNATVLEVARNAAQAAEQSERSKNKAQEGAELVARTVSSMNALQQMMGEKLMGNMHKLDTQSESIGQVMNVINDIADQTNLLALNAAIEAARAGDAGRGFAVVADEVRKLAEKTMGATKEVGENIKEIQNLAQANVAGMDEAVQAINEVTELSNSSGAMLQEILDMAELSAGQVQSIATAAEEQSAASEEITRSIDDINVIANENVLRVNETDSDIQKLVNQTNELGRRIADMKK